jgi:broad specificity phosphatase PhoE
VFEVVAASPLRRAWQSAALCPAAPVLLVPEFREIDFGRWEGLTAEEIEAQDPVLYRTWREKAPPTSSSRAASARRVSRARGGGLRRARAHVNSREKRPAHRAWSFPRGVYAGVRRRGEVRAGPEHTPSVIKRC